MTSNQVKFYSLSRITTRIAELLQPAMGKYFWVKAEISSAKEKGGSFYCDLVESDHKGNIIAKISCTIRARDLELIRKKFEKMNVPLSLTDGTSIGVCCSLQYSQKYSISLKITDADPFFTLGELEFKKREIIKNLQDEKLTEKNKQKYVKLLPVTIGLITSKDSAAYNDFISTLKASGYGFKIILANSTMQGPTTENSLLWSLHCIYKTDADIIVIIRGGGSKADLYSLDNEAIARKIAHCTKPVWTGIGHEIDLSVLDYVSHTFFKTPTAVAEHLVARYTEMDRHLEEAVEKFKTVWNLRLKREKEYLHDCNVGIVQGTRKFVDVIQSKLKYSVTLLNKKVFEHIAKHRNVLQRKKDHFYYLIPVRIKKSNELLTKKKEQLAYSTKQILHTQRTLLKTKINRFNLRRVTDIISIKKNKIKDYAHRMKVSTSSIMKLNVTNFNVLHDRFKKENILTRLPTRPVKLCPSGRGYKGLFVWSFLFLNIGFNNF